MSATEKDSYLAHLGMYANNYNTIWGQYDHLVDFIFDSYPKTKQRFDVIAAPLLHTMAHVIELGLKENIAFFREYHDIQHLKNFENLATVRKSHDLHKLAEEFKIGYYRLVDQLKLGREEREFFIGYYMTLADSFDVANCDIKR
jgi:hypothetical protein